jgi:uncharacterized protein YdgA (DUF945 family)
MARESGSLMPGLASTVSTLQLDPGDGNLIAVPGTLYSQVRLTGATASRYLLEAGAFAGDEVDVEWEGADVSMTSDASRRSLRYDGRINPLSVQKGDGSFRLGFTTIEGDSRSTEYGFMVGAISLSIDSLAIAPDSGAQVDTGKVQLDASSDIVGERVNAGMAVTIADFSLPEFGAVDVSMDLSATGLNARSVQAIVTEVQRAQRADDPDAALAALYPQIEQDLQTLLSAGAEIRVDRFDATLPQGEVTTRLRFQLPEAVAGADFSWAALVLALTASADLSIPVALMELAQSANPQSASLIAMGILKKDGDTYIVNAEYEKGLLTVNGAPMPIPLPGR